MSMLPSVTLDRSNEHGAFATLVQWALDYSYEGHYKIHNALHMSKRVPCVQVQQTHMVRHSFKYTKKILKMLYIHVKGLL